jgi:tRNA pseudouridine13 synthase
MPDKLRYPYGKPAMSGLLKSMPEDFIVTENLGFEPSGEGEHLFLWIEKSMLTTPELIEQVAIDFSVRVRDIGYSGLKDKIAVARQWLSLYLPGQMERLELPAISGYKILRQDWHNRKLRPGTHRSNHFEIIIRDVHAVPEISHRQLGSIRSQGMANYFGQQRFGRQDDNVERAMHVFTNARRTRKLSRSKRSLYLSALRSFLFNRILSLRIEHGYWSRPMPGDVFMLSGSQSIFHEPINDALLARYEQFDLSSTISLYGSGKRLLQNDALDLEDRILAENEIVGRCLIQQKAKLQMRAVRVATPDLSVEHNPQGSRLDIKVTLPRGSYLTSLLDHFVDTGPSNVSR